MQWLSPPLRGTCTDQYQFLPQYRQAPPSVAAPLTQPVVTVTPPEVPRTEGPGDANVDGSASSPEFLVVARFRDQIEETSSRDRMKRGHLKEQGICSHIDACISLSFIVTAAAGSKGMLSPVLRHVIKGPGLKPVVFELHK